MSFFAILQDFAPLSILFTYAILCIINFSYNKTSNRFIIKAINRIFPAPNPGMNFALQTGCRQTVPTGRPENPCTANQ